MNSPEHARPAQLTFRRFRKAPQAPKRFRSAYIFFSKAKMREIKDLGLLTEIQKSSADNTKITGLAKYVSQAWKELSPSNRSIWEDLAREDKKRYELDMKIYKGPKQRPIAFKYKRSSTLASDTRLAVSTAAANINGTKLTNNNYTRVSSVNHDAIQGHLKQIQNTRREFVRNGNLNDTFQADCKGHVDAFHGATGSLAVKSFSCENKGMSQAAAVLCDMGTPKQQFCACVNPYYKTNGRIFNSPYSPCNCCIAAGQTASLLSCNGNHLQINDFSIEARSVPVRETEISRLLHNSVLLSHLPCESERIAMMHAPPYLPPVVLQGALDNFHAAKLIENHYSERFFDAANGHKLSSTRLHLNYLIAAIKDEPSNCS